MTSDQHAAILQDGSTMIYQSPLIVVTLKTIALITSIGHLGQFERKGQRQAQWTRPPPGVRFKSPTLLLWSSPPGHKKKGLIREFLAAKRKTFLGSDSLMFPKIFNEVRDSESCQFWLVHVGFFFLEGEVVAANSVACIHGRYFISFKAEDGRIWKKLFSFQSHHLILMGRRWLNILFQESHYSV